MELQKQMYFNVWIVILNWIWIAYISNFYLKLHKIYRTLVKVMLVT